jgi:hypothetical protein
MALLLMKNHFLPCLLFFGTLLGGVVLGLQGCAERPPSVRVPLSERTVQDVLDLYGAEAEQRLEPYFYSAGVPYPPAAVAFLGFKAEQRLEVWARHQDAWVFIRAYRIEAASGTTGPKLREGDYQVPEGFYAIEALNPNSRFHLSLKLDYPNAVDRQQAALEGRDQLGGDIFLHGKDVSVGCLAMGDVAIEELFVLVARTGIERVTVLLAPYDFRQHVMQHDSNRPAWVEALYREIHRELGQFTRTPP